MTSNIKIKKINNEVSSIIIDEPKTYNSKSKLINKIFQIKKAPIRGAF